ncbi:hypothetical protein VTJ49DRAFT_6262 [Mycothermus thermophilus]|uniref:DUF7136 domain-containing protein n=1 Tax=Humicola insolens TaxID=85995 RepID=A0ABR3V1Q6_HUMIN
MKLSFLLSAAAAAFVTAQDETTEDSPTLQTQFELDIVFPWINSAYNSSDVLPIVFAVQNITALYSLGPNVTIDWNLRPLVARSLSLKFYEDSVDQGSFSIPDPSTLEDPSAPLFLVAATNVNSWIDKIEFHLDFITIQWQIRASGCQPDPVAHGDEFYSFLAVPPKWYDKVSQLITTVRAPEVAASVFETKFEPGDLLPAGCSTTPVAVVDVMGRDETNPTCAVAKELLGMDSYLDPLVPAKVLALTQSCSVVVDEDKAKSLNSQAAAYLASSPGAAAATNVSTTAAPTPTENAAAAVMMMMARPMQMAMAAAVILGGLVL